MILPDIPQFFKAMARVVRAWWLNHPMLVSPVERKRRMGICDVCFLNAGGQCLDCTCVLDLKTRFATESCPLQKW